MGGPDTPTHLLQDRAVRGLVALSGDNVEANVLTIILQLTFPNLASGDPGPAQPSTHHTTHKQSMTINGNHE